MKRVLNPPDGISSINFSKHLEEGGVITISTAYGDLDKLSRYLGYFIIFPFQTAVFNRNDNIDARKAHFLYVDEFQNYSNIGFAMMLSQGRHYHLAAHLAIQNRDFMSIGSSINGEYLVDMLTINTPNVILFPGVNESDALYYSDQFGSMSELKRKGIFNIKSSTLCKTQKKHSALQI